MLGEANWSELIARRAEPADDQVVEFKAALAVARSFSSPVKVLTTDGGTWWVKDPNPRVLRSLVTEHVVAGLGRLIKAPTCETAFVTIPAGVIVGSGNRVLAAGLGHASKDIPGVVEVRAVLKYRDDDDNQKRHAGLIAVYDWCCGRDGQWLHDTRSDNATYGHDHGHFLPGGPNWTVASLQQANPSTVFRPRGEAGTSLDGAEVHDVAMRLDNVTALEIAKVLCQVPASWNVSDDELCALGRALDARRPLVAARLRALVPTA